MIVIGLTGSIGAGKTTVASQFARLGARVCAADAIVHALLAPGGRGVDTVARDFPMTREGSGISRDRLGKHVFADAAALAVLEAILHPLVQEEERRFVHRQRRLGARLVVLDIPLLFETKAQIRCDYTAVATAPAFIQRRRVMKRPGMTQERLSAILARQMPDRQKRRLTDFVIHTGLGRAYSFRQVHTIVRQLTCVR